VEIFCSKHGGGRFIPNAATYLPNTASHTVKKTRYASFYSVGTEEKFASNFMKPVSGCVKLIA
jgi:hypothetical protein